MKLARISGPLLRHARGFNTSAALSQMEEEFRPPTKRFLKLKATQRRFQQEDNLPIHLKNGFKDKLLYNATMVSLLAGTIMSFDTLIRLILPH